MQKPDVKTSAKSVPILPSTAAGSSGHAIPISTPIPAVPGVGAAGGNVTLSRADSVASHVTTTVSASSLPLTSQPSLIHIQNRTVVGSTIAGSVPVSILRGAPQSPAASVMSQQHPSSFPPHLPRGPVAASALTLTKNSATAVLRTSGSAANQIPAAPSVPSVSVSVPVPGLPNALGRPQVISAIRPTTPPAPRSTSPAVSISDHTRTNLIVHGGTASGTGAAHLSGPPLQITLTQRVNTAGQAEGIKPGSLMALGAKTVHVSQPGQPHPLVQHPKVATGLQTGGVAGVGVTPQQLQQQAALAASKPGTLAVNAAVPAITINSLSAPVTPATVVAPASAAAPASIPIAKVTPQRQQAPLSTNLQQAPVAIQTVPSGGDYSSMPDNSAMATQSGASQLLLSQTHRGSAVTMATSSAIATLATSAATSLAAPTADRSVQPQHSFNLTATPGQGQDSMWLQHFLYQAQAPLVSATHNPSTIVRSGINTFFIPRPSPEPNKLTSQTPNLAASLCHTLTPAQPTVLFNPRMMVDSLRQPLPLGPSAAFTAATVTSAPASLTVVNTDSKPVISLSTNPALSGLPTSIITTSTTSAEHSLPASSSLHITTSIPAASAVASALSPGLSLAATLSNMPSRPTVASSIIAAAAAQQAHCASVSQPQPPGTPGGTSSSNTNPGSSPRPSILRKRTIDGNAPVPRRPNFNLTSESHSPRPDNTPLSNVSSPKTPATENSQSSTDTALSSNDATTPTHNSHTDVKIKQEPVDTLENGTNMAASPAVSLSGSITDASPRKRARKQLFDVSHRNVNEELKDNTSTDDEIEHQTDVKDETADGPTEKRNEYIDEDGVRWTTEKTKPSISILGEYTTTWKPRCNHFLRYSDVRPKDDRRPTVNELANQRGILQKSSGWKLFHMAAQLEDLMENEQKTHQKIAEIKASLAARIGSRQGSDPDFNVLQELTQANLQRCQLISDQLQEAKQNMLNILNHRPKIQEIIHKNLSKRPIKKKERT